MREEVIGFFKESHELNKYVISLYSTFLVLMPKIGNAVDLKDFRHNSLMEGFVKILETVLANRLKGVMGKVLAMT